MPRRYYQKFTDAETGLSFLFAIEVGSTGPLHIAIRHGTTPADAVAAYFAGVTTWNGDNKRFETSTASHVVYWAWHRSGAVLVISCFRKGDE